MEFNAYFLFLGCADCNIFQTGSSLIIINSSYRLFNSGILRLIDSIARIKDHIGFKEFDNVKEK